MKTKQKNISFTGEVLERIACLFINKTYQEGTLDKRGREKLVVNVSAFDCMTFVETVLALTRCALSEKLTPGVFKHHLKWIRYRGGKISGYSSRLHYFTDWLRDNVEKKMLIDISARLGGIPRRRKIDFMSTHPELYPPLKNKTQLNRITAIEKKLSRKASYIIDKEKIATPLKKIQSGDVIAFTTGRQGLDVAHVGFAIRRGKSLRLLHASKNEGKVVISPKTLAAYLKSNKLFTGIIVARSTFQK